MLIDKSVIGSLAFGRTTKLKNIDLYYISLISKELERMVDRIICLDKNDKKFLEEITKPIEILQNISQDTTKLSQAQAMEFAKEVSLIKNMAVKDVRTNDMSRIKQNLTAISEVVMDWMVTLKIEN